MNAELDTYKRYLLDRIAAIPAHMLEHAGLHLGHIHVTRQWLRQHPE